MLSTRLQFQRRGCSGCLHQELGDAVLQRNHRDYQGEKPHSLSRQEGCSQIPFVENDQWVSYDDKDTFAAKIKLANGLGLGGLLIWSVDQDTPDLKALQAVLAPKDIRAFAKNADGAAYWQDVAAQDCYVSDCGKGCDKPGFIKITNQPCGSATPVFRHSSEDDSSLCCPLAAAPDSNECRWRGSAPSCNGHCEDGEVVVELNKWGDGKYCEDGNKAYCCNIPEGKENNCYWTGAGGRCKSGDELLVSIPSAEF